MEDDYPPADEVMAYSMQRTALRAVADAKRWPVMIKDIPVQQWDPAEYAENARFVSALATDLIGLLNPRAGERVLDLGCGDGELAAQLVEHGCSVVGVDASPEMVAAAKKRGLDARVGDGQQLAFDREFDAVFSNAALHWMASQPDAVVDGVWRALKPGGRFVGEFGGYGNVTTVVAALEAALRRRGADVGQPWYFPRPEAYRAALEKRGFTIDSVILFPRPTELPGDIGGWLETFAKPYLRAVPQADRKKLIGELVEELGPILRTEDGKWIADYVRLRFHAHKTSANNIALEPTGMIPAV